MDEIKQLDETQKRVLEDLKHVFKSEHTDFKFYQKVFSEVFAHGIANSEKVLHRGVAEMADRLQEYYWTHKNC